MVELFKPPRDSSLLEMKKQTIQKGQVTVEYILLAVVLIALFQLTTQTLKTNGYLKEFQETPQKVFRNMVENGNWKLEEAQSRKYHPNHYESQYTPDGKGP